MTLFGTRSLRSLFTHPGFAEGVRAIAGPALGTVALGLVTGVAMARSGPPMGAVLAMSLLVFASASQLACLPMILAGAPLWVIVLTALMLNVRFVVFSAHWRRYFGLLPRPQRPGLAYLAGVTVLTRGVFLLPRRAPRLPGWLALGLRHAPLAALMAVVVPEVLRGSASAAARGGWHDPRWLAVAASVAWFWWRRGVTGPVVVGTAALLLLRSLGMVG